MIKPNLQKAVKAIKAGKILICPTDTVYGLICDAGNKKAIDRIYLIKKRPKSKPLPIFVRSIAMAKKIAKINKIQEGFLKSAVTVVLKSKKGEKTIGIRMPKYKLVLDIIGRLGRPLAETSANISGRRPTTKIKEVLKYFKGRKYQPDLILDGGNLKLSKPSKVIDLTELGPKILRK